MNRQFLFCPHVKRSLVLSLVSFFFSFFFSLVFSIMLFSGIFVCLFFYFMNYEHLMVPLQIYVFKISFEFSRSISNGSFLCCIIIFFSLLFFFSFSSTFFFIYFLSSSSLFLHFESGKTKSIILYLTHLYLEHRSSTHKPPTHRTWSRATPPSNGTFGSMWNRGGAF